MSRPKRPYPFVRRDGRVVVDELCRCGHSRTKHFDLNGACEVPHDSELACECRAFFWSCEVYQGGQTGFLA